MQRSVGSFVSLCASEGKDKSITQHEVVESLETRRGVSYVEPPIRAQNNASVWLLLLANFATYHRLA